MEEYVVDHQKVLVLVVGLIVGFVAGLFLGHATGKNNRIDKDRLVQLTWQETIKKEDVQQLIKDCNK